MADLSNVPWNEFPLDAGPRDKVSPNFVYYELTRSETAERHGVDNTIKNAEEAQAAVYVCRNVIQRVREEFGKPFNPNSVYRSQALERALKHKPADWVSKSQHTRGEACDIEVPGLSNMDLTKWIIDNLEFDQIILECYDPARGPNSGWVHVSLKPPGRGDNRREILSYVRDSAQGRFVYVHGLHESP